MYLTPKQRSAATACLLLGAGALACSAPGLGGGEDGGEKHGDGDGDAGGDGDGDAGGDGDGDAGGNSGDGDGDGGVVELPEGVEAVDLLPARIRRLTNDEYDTSVQALLGTTQAPGANFPPNSRQHGYSVNEAQRVDPILARALDTAAILLADEARQKLNSLAPCSDPAQSGKECAASFVDAFAKKAYRRSVKSEEKDALLALYDAATAGEGADANGTPESIYADGIAHMIRGILQSPGFLYLTETGGADVPAGEVRLTASELASSLSYLLTAAPPDAELTAAAEDGTLRDPAVREAQARRLMSSARGQERAVEVLQQWLGIDRISVTSKDATVYEKFAGVRDQMAQEAEDFISGVLEFDGGGVRTLLSAESAVAPPELANIYSGAGPARNGLLNQGAFLSVYAHAHETSPVLRGVAVMRRVACIDIELPPSLSLEIVPPVPDPSLTTRERFDIHSQDPDCRTCHNSIDPIGFVFEQFDGMGAHRTMEHTNPVDSSAEILIGMDFDGSYNSSTEFANALAASTRVAECFAKQLFRAHAAEGSGIFVSEQAFINEVGAAQGEANFIETMVAFVRSDSFIYRKEGLQ